MERDNIDFVIQAETELILDKKYKSNIFIIKFDWPSVCFFSASISLTLQTKLVDSSTLVVIFCELIKIKIIFENVLILAAWCLFKNF